MVLSVLPLIAAPTSRPNILFQLQDLSWCVPKKDQGKSLVLYDLEKDPNEAVDVASAHPDIVAKLKPLLPPLGTAEKRKKK